MNRRAQPPYAPRRAGGLGCTDAVDGWLLGPAGGSGASLLWHAAAYAADPFAERVARATDRNDARELARLSALLHVAEEHFALYGYEAASTNAMLAALRGSDAELAKGTLYTYFPSKAALYLAVLAGAVAQLDRAWLDATREIKRALSASALVVAWDELGLLAGVWREGLQRPWTVHAQHRASTSRDAPALWEASRAYVFRRLEGATLPAGTLRAEGTGGPLTWAAAVPERVAAYVRAWYPSSALHTAREPAARLTALAATIEHLLWSPAPAHTYAAALYPSARVAIEGRAPVETA